MDEYSGYLCPHAALLVTSLENTIVDQRGSTPHFILKGTDPNLAKNLRTYGEIGIVYTKPPIRNKFENHGIPCMFICYAEDHTSNVFKFYNPKTYAIILSRNVYWLSKSYGEFTKFGLMLLLANCVRLTATWQMLLMIFPIGRIHHPMLSLEP
jgi:hypothetical protein